MSDRLCRLDMHKPVSWSSSKPLFPRASWLSEWQPQLPAARAIHSAGLPDSCLAQSVHPTYQQTMSALLPKCIWTPTTSHHPYCHHPPFTWIVTFGILTGQPCLLSYSLNTAARVILFKSSFVSHLTSPYCASKTLCSGPSSLLPAFLLPSVCSGHTAVNFHSHLHDYRQHGVCRPVTHKKTAVRW